MDGEAVSSAPLTLQPGEPERGELVEEVHGRAYRLLPVAEIQALVLRVGGATRVLDTGEEARRAGKSVGEGLQEADRRPGADERGLPAIALLERPQRRLEGRPGGLRRPPGCRARDPRGDVGAGRRLRGQPADEPLPR